MIRRKDILFCVFVICVTILNVPAAESGQAARPNVLFIMADDLGWSDTTLFGTTNYYETPNIEKLAERGMLWTRAYSASPLCSPTRASIMTGLYPARLGITEPHWVHPLKAQLAKSGPANQRCLEAESAQTFSAEHLTLAQVLKKAGYTCGHFGKWHLGAEPLSALERGFDVDVPHHPAGAPDSGYLAPWTFLGKNRSLRGTPGEHLEDRMVAEAVKFMKTHKDEPFFLNYWAYSVHSPWSAKSELVEKYRKKIKPNASQANPVYAAMIESFDQAVGTLLQAVDELDLTDNTIIIFFSDNGGNTYAPTKTSPQGFEHIPTTNNFPLRAGKSSLYEGGTRVPCIFVWPDTIRPGSQTNALFSSVDFLPTLSAMLNIKLPVDLTLDGVNQIPTLLGKGPARTSAFCYHPHYSHRDGDVPGAWVQQGSWKLLRFFCDNDDQTDRFVLYNLENDINETNNRAKHFPDKVQELKQLLDEYLAGTGAIIPAPNPDYKQ